MEQSKRVTSIFIRLLIIILLFLCILYSYWISYSTGYEMYVNKYIWMVTSVFSILYFLSTRYKLKHFNENTVKQISMLNQNLQISMKYTNKITVACFAVISFLLLVQIIYSMMNNGEIEVFNPLYLFSDTIASLNLIPHFVEWITVQLFIKEKPIVTRPSMEFAIMNSSLVIQQLVFFTLEVWWLKLASKLFLSKKKQINRAENGNSQSIYE